MLYPQYFIDDLKTRADLVRLVEPYAELKKKGARWMACCPFHQEKTPSFSVNPSKGLYKCFGCGKGGDAYSFLMEMEGLNFFEAVQRVAEVSGVPLPEPIDDKKYEENKKRKEEKKKLADQVIDLNRIALEFWESELGANSAKAKSARVYLESRGIDDKTQRAFHIGFAPDSWDSLLNLLRQKHADENIIQQSGLVSVSEDKEKVFDRFRGRIIFPVFDINGNPVAFGARALGDEQPKYLNSPETAAYIKGQHLYGLFQSRDEIRKKKFSILVEGYLDLIALYQFGITNTVASLGTALTPEQSKLLSRFTKQVVINYDGDDAGIKAARRAVETLLPQDFDIKILILPEGRDPDDFIRANGSEAFNELRGKASPHFQFVLDNSVKQRNLSVPKQKAEAVEDVLPVLAAVRNPIQKRESFDQAMNFFRVEDSALKRELWNAVKHGGQVVTDAVRQKVARAAKPKITVAEERLLELLVHDRELRNAIFPQLEETDYQNLATAAVYAALLRLHSSQKEISLENFLDQLDESDEFSRDLVPLLLMNEPPREPGDVLDEVLEGAENCVLTLRSMAVSHRIAEISQHLMHAEQSGDTPAVNELAAEQIDLARIRRELQRKIVEM